MINCNISGVPRMIKIRIWEKADRILKRLFTAKAMIRPKGREKSKVRKNSLKVT